jgi:DNA-directed RNA polymerase specialized sigma24 family protein
LHLSEINYYICGGKKCCISGEPKHSKAYLYMDKNHQAFEALLLRIEPGFSDSEKRYKQLRIKMVKFFAWRRCEDPEGLADETIGRVVKNLNMGEEIRADNPYSYIYAIAKYVFMEYIREKKKREIIVNDLPEHIQTYSENSQDCRTQCLQKLPKDKLSLLHRYYLGEENREVLAQYLNISLNALRLQVHRLKQELRVCEEECLDNLRGR